MNDLVFAQNGQVLTNSLTIANVFDKRHTDVMRSIKSLEIPEDLRQRNFAQTFKIVKMPNGAQRKDPVFNLTKDGFVLLVMGFTGKKAMEFKIKYIEAFNAMERALSERNVPALDAKVIGEIVKKYFSKAVREELANTRQKQPEISEEERFILDSLRAYAKRKYEDGMIAGLLEGAFSQSQNSKKIRQCFMHAIPKSKTI